MSDPVTNAEIEDVLSSIRRLVSENVLPQPAAKAVETQRDQDLSPKPAFGTVRAADKLVLTPDFRVHETREAKDEPRSEPVPLETSELLENEEELSGTVASVEPVQDPQSEHQDATDADPWQDLKDDVSEHLASSEHVEPDAKVHHDQAPSHAKPEAASDLEEPLQLNASEQEPETPNTASTAWPADISASFEGGEEETHLEDRVAELEAAVSDSSVEFEPDLGDTVEDLGPGIFLRQRAERAPKADDDTWEKVEADVSDFVDAARAVDGAAADTDADEEDLRLGEDDTLIDEDMLRDLVVRLVREELQGAVGEKITRNVRRLVRREIERALTLKSLE